MTEQGFAWFILPTAALFSLPLLAVLGSPILWVLLGFIGFAVWAVWKAIRINQADRRIDEELRLWTDHAELVHRPKNGDPLRWEANPYWVRVNLKSDGGPVENYLTLNGGGREVELGAFLSPEERSALKSELELQIARLRAL